MKYGYARCITRQPEHSLAARGLEAGWMQDAFQGLGLIRSHDQEPALLRCLKALQVGDALIVWKLDRLGCTRLWENRLLRPVEERSMNAGRRGTRAGAG
jgi:DNA invertase Pin-like site-specific DNA recombinase